jgi:hypothetical protein
MNVEEAGDVGTKYFHKKYLYDERWEQLFHNSKISAYCTM